MIKVERPVISDEEGARLLELARAKRQALIDAFGESPKPAIDEALYKRYKNYLLAAFNRKCAYCETVIQVAQTGDVEHFRPKGRVVDEDFRPIKVTYEKWGEIDHPGYFWLAYDWDNLLPSCEACNRYRRYGEDGGGKADRFPVASFRASLPGEEEEEEALLVDPTRVDPDDHLIFFPNGLVQGKTKVGEETIENIGLIVREDLVNARRDAFEQAVNSFELLVQMPANDNPDKEKRLGDQVNAIWEGRAAYSAVARLGLEKVRQDYRRRRVELPLPWTVPEPEPFAGVPGAAAAGRDGDG